MIRKALLFLLITIFIACRSAEEHNKQFSTLKSERQLKSDVDFVYKKLRKFHPQLNKFISEEDLKYKFDSLKASITTSLTPNDFYLKLSPVVASIRQGHTTVSVPFKISKLEAKQNAKLGYKPLFPFRAELINNKYYIIRDYQKGSGIKPGTEILSINGISPQEIFNRYESGISTDGYINTSLPKQFSLMAGYYFMQSGILDDVNYQLRFKDSTWALHLRSDVPLLQAEKTDPKTVRAPAKSGQVKKQPPQNQKYALLSNKKVKRVGFLKADSSVALMHISAFSKDDYEEFYNKSFKLLASAKTKALIIDIRDNPGGRIRDALDLYSYLVDTSFYFSNKYEFTSRTSFLRNYRFLANNHLSLPRPLHNAIANLCAIPPSLFIGVKMKKLGSKRYSYSNKSSRLNPVKEEHFPGKVYVLIDGGTFSASSILAANLKGSKRAVFVGTETAGAQNGCVAGFLPKITLPHSKLNLRFGLTSVEPHYLSDIEGRGIFPDVEIVPTLEDRIKKIDRELNWVLKDMEGRSSK